MKSGAWGTVILGLVFVTCGTLWLFGNLFNLNLRFDLLWPAFLLLPGLGFWFGYLVNRREWGLTIPGTILVMLGLTFFLNVFVDEGLKYSSIWAVTAFMYPGSVAVALWVGWLLSGRDMGLAIGAGILSIISLFIFCTTSLVVLIGDTVFGNTASRFIWPLGLLCLGFFIIITPLFSLPGKKRVGDWEKMAQNFGDKMEEVGKQIENAFEPKKKDSAKKHADDKVEEAEIVND